MTRDVFALDSFTAVEAAAAELSRRRYFAAPIVDTERRIVGIVKAEHLLHGVQQEVPATSRSSSASGRTNEPSRPSASLSASACHGST